MKMFSKETEREKRKSFQAGVKAAAVLADRYNDASLMPYRLGDCVENQLTSNKAKMPRRNKPTKKTLVLARELLLKLKVTDEDVVQLARAVMPASWEDYEAQEGKIDALTAWMCLESLAIAKDVLAAGYRACAPAKPIAPCMQKDARKKALASAAGPFVKGNKRSKRTGKDSQGLCIGLD